MRQMLVCAVLLWGCNNNGDKPAEQKPGSASPNEEVAASENKVTITPHLRPECPITVRVGAMQSSNWDNTKAAADFLVHVTCAIRIIDTETIVHFRGGRGLAPSSGTMLVSRAPRSESVPNLGGDLLSTGKGPSYTVYQNETWEQVLLTTALDKIYEPGDYTFTVWPDDGLGGAEPGGPPAARIQIGDKIFIKLLALHWSFPGEGKGTQARPSAVNLNGPILTVAEQ